MSIASIVVALLPAADSIIWAGCALAAGALAGRLLTTQIGGLLDSGAFSFDDSPVRVAVNRGSRRRWIEAASAAAAVALWWWEVRCQGLGPVSAIAGGVGGASQVIPGSVLLGRWAAHAVLALLLAAAAWIDIRHRVIPDCITVPGVVLGLIVLWLLPDVLLPIACEVPRSYATPSFEADVLGWFGGLRSQAPPVAMDGAPHLPGLLVSAAIYWLWWFVCTAPFLMPVDDGEAVLPVAPRWRVEPRNVLLIVGLVAIAAAWLAGGDRFRGLQSALVGLAVSAGLVWAVREGASRAMGREAMGLGDVTLMAMVGAWVGWQACVLAFFLAAFIGLAHGLMQLVRHRENELPYGPSLCLASAGVIVGWRPLWELTGETFSQPLMLAGVLGAVVGLTAATLSVWRRLRG